MNREYDLSDPTDLELLKSDFEMYTPDDWQGMIDYSLESDFKRKISYDERGILMTARKKALYKSHPTAKQMVWALKIADKIEQIKTGGNGDEG